MICSAVQLLKQEFGITDSKHKVEIIGKCNLALFFFHFDKVKQREDGVEEGRESQRKYHSHQEKWN